MQDIYKAYLDMTEEMSFKWVNIFNIIKVFIIFWNRLIFPVETATSR